MSRIDYFFSLWILVGLSACGSQSANTLTTPPAVADKKNNELPQNSFPDPVPCDGTNSSEIFTVSDLDKIRNDLDGEFLLCRDLDLTGIDFDPIGDASAFTGTFDGNSHQIKFLTIASSDLENVGFFSKLANGASVKNLIFITPQISGGNQVGTLAGRLEVNYLLPGDIDIQNIRIEQLTLTHQGRPTQPGYTLSSNNIGGLIGLIYNPNQPPYVPERRVRLSNIFIEGQVSSEKVSSSETAIAYVGGIVGQAGALDLRNASFTGEVLCKDLLLSNFYCSSIGGGVGGAFGNSYVSSLLVESIVQGDRARQIGGAIGSMGYAQLSQVMVSSQVIDTLISESGARNAGGFVGLLDEGSQISQAMFSGEVTGKVAGGGFGRIVVNGDPIYIKDIFIQSQLSSFTAVGGLAGAIVFSSNLTDRLTIQYTLVDSPINSGSPQGGFIGTIVNSGMPNIQDAYWNSDHIAVSAGNYASGRPEAELKVASLYNSWNQLVWEIKDGEFPALKNLP